MQKNVGGIDRGIRIVVGIAIIAAGAVMDQMVILIRLYLP